MKRRWSSTHSALLVGFCALATLFSLDIYSADQPSSSPESSELSRYLKVTSSGKLENNLIPITVPPDYGIETPLFWHIPKSGGTTVKAIYKCMNLTMANRQGVAASYGHDQDEELIAFRPFGIRGTAFVNVDTTSREGILRAERLGLVPSGIADIIFTSIPNFAIDHLYDSSNKGRVMAMFRHPVDRLISKFYYLQVADWEPSYRPEWKGMSIGYWAKEVNDDNNHMVKHITGKNRVTKKDLKNAMQILKGRFVVGRTDKMEESIHRFNIIMGIDESDNISKKCMGQCFGPDAKKANANSHPKVKEGSQVREKLARANALDMKLYEYILDLFDEQKEIIGSYSKFMVA